MSDKRCFACDRKTGKNPNIAVTSDLAQSVFVGSECYKMIGPEGWQPPKGGPKLYRIRIVSVTPPVIEVIGMPDAALPQYVIDSILR